MRIDVFVDDERAPRASFVPPGQLELARRWLVFARGRGPLRSNAS